MHGYLKLNTFFLLAISFIFLSACSSSSNSQRYNKPEKKTPERESSSVRFTSKDTNQDKDTLVSSNVNASDEFDIPPVEDDPVNTKEFVEKFSHLKTLSSALTEREKILFEIIAYLDTPYQYGGDSREGIDCSAFTRSVFERAIGMNLPRTASEQFTLGNEISDPENLEFGDLLFFDTTSRSYPGHVGVYIGNDLFAHASRSLGVTISSIETNYYHTRFISGKRIK